jgi:hypothetical protein
VAPGASGIKKGSALGEDIAHQLPTPVPRSIAPSLAEPLRVLAEPKTRLGERESKIGSRGGRHELEVGIERFVRKFTPAAPLRALSDLTIDPT